MQGEGAATVDALQSLGWVDTTALGVLAVFFVLGLFKGLIWQVSRIGILIAAYVVAGRHGADVANWLSRPADAEAAAAMGAEPATTTIYLAYCLCFLAVLIVLSLLAIVVQKLAVKAGLGFYDRLGGGLLGVATGGCVVLFGVFFVLMFFRGSQLAGAVEDSHGARLSRLAVDWLGPRVPPELRQVFALPALPQPTPATGTADGGQPVEASHREPEPGAPEEAGGEAQRSVPGGG
jgi:membrane protein required for colicin V production